MRRISVFALSAAFLLSGSSLALAQDQSSANFQNNGSAVIPADFTANSANYQISGTLDAITGLSNSPSFTIQHGEPVKPGTAPVTPTPPPPSGGGGGGGGGGGLIPVTNVTTTVTTTTAVTSSTAGTVQPPTLLFQSPTFLSHETIGGAYESGQTIVVNGAETGVTLTPSLYWSRDLPLFLGLNDIQVRSKNSAGALSEIIGGTAERMLIGDINRSHKVDDVDLSLFTKAWKQYNFFADFNEDKVIDDIDLSLLVSHWGLFY